MADKSRRRFHAAGGWLRSLEGRGLGALLDNWGMKLLALVVTLGLVVAIRYDKVGTLGVDVAVTYVMPEHKSLVGRPVEGLSVTLRGPKRLLEKVRRRGLSPVQVDLSQAHEGILHFVPLLEVPPGLTVISVNPARAKLAFSNQAGAK